MSEIPKRRNPMRQKAFGLLIIVCAGLTSLYAQTTPNRANDRKSPQTTATSLKEKYELQERCGKRAAEKFKDEYGNGTLNTEDGFTRTNYRNHYNQKLNKCFILVTSIFLPNKEKESVSEQFQLDDVNENNDYGSFFKFNKNARPDICHLSGTACESKEQWESLLKPFMED